MRKLSVIIVALLCAWLAAGADATRRPAVFFCDFCGKNNSAVNQELIDSGFELGRSVNDYPKNSFPLTWEKMKEYNVIVFIGMASDFKPEHATLVKRFLDEGGGVLFMPIGHGVLDWQPSRGFFENDMGLKIFIEQIQNPAKTGKASFANGRFKMDFIWTDAIAPSPVTEGVINLWYPAGRAPFYYGAAPLDLSPEWKPLVKTGPGASTYTKADNTHDYLHPDIKLYCPPEGRSGDFTLTAIRDFGKGRAAAVSVSPMLLFWGGYIPVAEGVLMKTGLDGRPSDWARLFKNLLAYLAEPSLKSGALGGHVTKRSEVFTQEPGDPDVKVVDGLELPAPAGKCLTGLAGAKSEITSGKGSVAEWSAAAKGAGYDFLIFLEDLDKLNADKWGCLQDECLKSSSEQFLAYPGVEFKTELGDRGFYIDGTGYWPNQAFLTKDGRFFSTRQGNWARGELFFRTGMPKRPGIAEWPYLPLGFFSHAGNPIPFWNYNTYQVLSVFSREQGKLLDNWDIGAYREVNAQKLHIAPFALNLMRDRSEMPKPFADGLACLSFPGDIKRLRKELDTLGQYAYNGLSTQLSVSSGPRITQWNAVGDLSYNVPRWQSGPKESDFYNSPNYRFKMRLSAESDAGLAEIAILDGLDTYRRFLPGGAKRFDVTLDAVNDHHAHYIAMLTDTAGRKSVSGEIETENWLNRIYWCSDRCNFGSAPYVHSAGVANPVQTTTLGIDRKLINRWTFPVYGPDCGIVQGNVAAMFRKGATPTSGWRIISSPSPSPASAGQKASHAGIRSTASFSFPTRTWSSKASTPSFHGQSPPAATLHGTTTARR